MKFTVSNKQRVRLWALNQAYPGFNGGVTWNTAQANHTASNELLTTGPFTAATIGTDVLIPTSGTTPYTFTIPRLGDVLISNRVTLVLSGVSDGANNAGGLRMQRTNAILGFSLLSGHTPPAFSTLGPQTIHVAETAGPIPFTLTDDLDPAASLDPFAASSDANVVPVENIVFGGSDNNRTVTLTAGSQTGAATITLYAVDSQSLTGTTSFVVTVLSTNPPPVDTNRYDVYLAAGQSNMDGRGSTSELTGDLASWNQPQTDVRVFYANPVNLDPLNPTYNTGWQMLTPGFSVPPGFSGTLPSTRFGPELAFARAVADANTNRSIALIKVSQGGTSLSSDWKPTSGYMYATLTNIARVALQSLTNSGAQYTLRGMIWHQGESDGSLSTATYQARLTEFIAAVRNDFGVANLPFVVGELATNRSLTVRQAQLNVSETVPYVGFASSSNLVTLAPDDPHFTSEGALIMGQRMAAALEIPARAAYGSPPLREQCHPGGLRPGSRLMPLADSHESCLAARAVGNGGHQYLRRQWPIDFHRRRATGSRNSDTTPSRRFETFTNHLAVDSISPVAIAAADVSRRSERWLSGQRHLIQEDCFACRHGGL